MRAVIFCNTHGDISTVDAETQQALEQVLSGALVGCHAAHPRCTLSFQFLQPPSQDRLIDHLSISCKQCNMTVEHDVEVELVGALTLVFHTAHEGHGLILRYGDRTWESPVKK